MTPPPEILLSEEALDTWSARRLHALLQAQPDRIFGIISNDVLLAIPFFTLIDRGDLL